MVLISAMFCFIYHNHMTKLLMCFIFVVFGLMLLWFQSYLRDKVLYISPLLRTLYLCHDVTAYLVIFTKSFKTFLLNLCGSLFFIWSQLIFVPYFASTIWASIFTRVCRIKMNFTIFILLCFLHHGFQLFVKWYFLFVDFDH